jgi:hypothetical protein
MATAAGPFPNGASRARGSGEVTAQAPIAVYSCNRLGRVANPPGFSLSDWFRSGRRRRMTPVSAA